MTFLNSKPKAKGDSTDSSKILPPHNDYIAWYTPDINGKEPDFILFSRQSGLIIFEVKQEFRG
jgi:hypothetical protein